MQQPQAGANGHNGPNVGGVNQGNPIKKRDKHVPQLTFKHGQLQYFESSYTFGPEGDKALRGYFSRLSATQPNPDGSGAKFKIHASEDHPHPVGATMRAYLNDKIVYDLVTEDYILDVGTSPARLFGRWDYKYEGQECKLSERVYSMAPLITGRDIHRQRTHFYAKMPTMCDCVGGWKRRDCKNCCPDDGFKVAISVDSVYYPGVLEEIVWQTELTGGVGYIVFNDYHHAMRKTGLTGRACDNESHYIIEHHPGKESIVTSTVKGNIAPYEHGFLRTEGEFWQYQMENPTTKEVYFVVFETLSEFWNHDIPYKLCRVVAIDQQFLPDDEKAGIKGVPLMSSVFYQTEASINLDDSVDLSPAKLLSGLSSIGSTENKTPTPTTSMTEPVLPKKEEIAEDFPSLNTLDVPEFYHKKPPIFGEKIVDFRIRYAREIESFKTWQTIMQAWNSEFELLHTSVENKTTFVTLTAKTKVCCLPFLCSKDRCCGLFKRSGHFKAPLKLVMAAYSKIGNKRTIEAERYCVTECQKDDKFIKDNGLTLYDQTMLPEAFIIASAIRAQETLRRHDAEVQIPSMAARNLLKK
jgi:hypothetical protein